MKYSIFTVCMKDLTPEQLLPELKKHGYDGVEWRVTQPNYDASRPLGYWDNNRCNIDVNTVVERAGEIRAMCAQYGIEMPALGTYVTSAQYEEAAEMLKAAALLGCPKVRVTGLRYDGSGRYDELLFASQAGFAKLVPVARHYGVQMDVEMHPNTLTPSASAARRMVDPFDPAVVGVIYDVGNTVNEGFEDYKMGLEILGPYLSHVHIKNARLAPDGQYDDGGAKYASAQAPLWGGMAAFAKFNAALRAVGYDGYLSCEDFNDEMTTPEKLARNIEYLKKVFG